MPKIDGKEKVEIPINLELPAPFDSVLGKQATGSATLQATSDGGLKLSGLNVHIENVSLGIAQIKTFNILYAGDPNLLQGDTDILLPPAGSELGVAFGLKDGDFDYGRGEFTFPPGSLVVATDVLLRKIRFAVEKASSCAKPTKISGGVTLTTGPDVAGTGLISVDGNVSYSFPQSSCGTPGILDIDGAGSLAGFPVANLHSRFTTDGQFTFDTVVSFDVTVASASVGVDGGIDIPSKTFYASGKGSVKSVRLHDLPGELDHLQHRRGAVRPRRAGHRHGLRVPLGRKPGPRQLRQAAGLRRRHRQLQAGGVRPALARRTIVLAAASATGSFSLPKGLPLATVRLDGAGAAPGFGLSGPGGLKISYPTAAGGPTSTKGYAVVPVGTETFVRLERPAAGAYTVSGVNGPIVTALAVAQRPARPEGDAASVGGRGGKRVLTFKVKPIAGQKVTFAEQGKGVKDVIGETAQRRGVLRFKPALGVGRKRTVIAIVSQDGVPREEIEVAKFTRPSVAAGPPEGREAEAQRQEARGQLETRPRARAGSPSPGRCADGRRPGRDGQEGPPAVRSRACPGSTQARSRSPDCARDNVAGKSVKREASRPNRSACHAKKRKRGKGRATGAGRSVAARQLDQQPHAVAAGVVAGVLAADVPGGAGDVDVGPGGLADELLEEGAGVDRARLALRGERW